MFVLVFFSHYHLINWDWNVNWFCDWIRFLMLCAISFLNFRSSFIFSKFHNFVFQYLFTFKTDVSGQIQHVRNVNMKSRSVYQLECFDWRKKKYVMFMCKSYVRLVICFHQWIKNYSIKREIHLNIFVNEKCLKMLKWINFFLSRWIIHKCWNSNWSMVLCDKCWIRRNGRVNSVSFSFHLLLALNVKHVPCTQNMHVSIDNNV